MGRIHRPTSRTSALPPFHRHRPARGDLAGRRCIPILAAAFAISTRRHVFIDTRRAASPHSRERVHCENNDRRKDQNSNKRMYPARKKERPGYPTSAGRGDPQNTQNLSSTAGNASHFPHRRIFVTNCTPQPVQKLSPGSTTDSQEEHTACSLPPGCGPPPADRGRTLRITIGGAPATSIARKASSALTKRRSRRVYKRE